MRYCQPPKRGDILFEQELDRHRQAAAHNDIAFAAAFHLCAEEGKCPPPWLLTAVDKILIELLKREKANKRGRAAGRVARCRQDLWDFDRWCAVDGIRTLRTQNAHDVEVFKGVSPAERKHFSHVEKIRDWRRYGTFECASMSLAGTYAWGSCHAVRSSYRRVRKAMATRTAAARYYMFPGDFLHRVGIPYLLTLRPGKKWVPFYDLTP